MAVIGDYCLRVVSVASANGVGIVPSNRKGIKNMKWAKDQNMFVVATNGISHQRN